MSRKPLLAETNETVYWKLHLPTAKEIVEKTAFKYQIGFSGASKLYDVK